MRVLIVEDNRMLRQELRALLEHTVGMEVVGTAQDGEAAVRLAPEFTPDVVVMDISLPGISGVEATRRIVRQTPKPRLSRGLHTPIGAS